MARPVASSGEKTASATIKTGAGRLRGVEFAAALATDVITLRDGTENDDTPILCRLVGSGGRTFPGEGIAFGAGLRLVVENGTPTAINVYYN